jgi:hypothetical protein
MKRCSYCNLIVWPWQARYLGSPPAHRNCDYKAFVAQLDNFVRQGIFPAGQAEIQKVQRWMHSYSRMGNS